MRREEGAQEGEKRRAGEKGRPRSAVLVEGGEKGEGGLGEQSDSAFAPGSGSGERRWRAKKRVRKALERAGAPDIVRCASCGVCGTEILAALISGPAEEIGVWGATGSLRLGLAETQIAWETWNSASVRVDTPLIVAVWLQAERRGFNSASAALILAGAIFVLALLESVTERVSPR